MRYLVDTCVISELMKKRPDKNVLAWVREQEESALFLSVLTLGELEKGVSRLEDGSKKQQFRDWIDHDLKRRFSGRVLPLDYETACRWGLISGQADRAGAPMPVVDVMLAATALIHGLTLVTRNTDDVAPSNVPVLNPWIT